MTNSQLEQVLRFKDPVWTKKMVFAYRLGLMFIELEKKYFPTRSTGMAKFPKVGDPRKGELFKICFKMINDNHDRLKPEHFPLFMEAQVSILKKIKSGSLDELFYGPRCLIGKNSWYRWCVWKKYAQAQKAEATEPAVEINFDDCLTKTKVVLESKIRPLNKETLLESIQTGQLFRLAALKAVSPVFLSCCPAVAKHVEGNPEVAERYNLKLQQFPAAAVKYRELFGHLD